MKMKMDFFTCWEALSNRLAEDFIEGDMLSSREKDLEKKRLKIQSQIPLTSSLTLLKCSCCSWFKSMHPKSYPLLENLMERRSPGDNARGGLSILFNSIME